MQEQPSETGATAPGSEHVGEPGAERAGKRLGEREDRVIDLERAAIAGELAFVSPEAQVQRTAELLGEGVIVVDVATPAASLRGRLGEHIDDRIERALGVHGAPSPYLTTWSAMPDEADASARLADQLFRARSVGATGIAVAMGSLWRVAAPALTPEDSATLRSLAEATAKSAFVVLIDDGDETVGAYQEPVALGPMLARVAGVGQDDDEVEVEVDGVEVEAQAVGEGEREIGVGVGVRSGDVAAGEVTHEHEHEHEHAHEHEHDHAHAHAHAHEHEHEHEHEHGHEHGHEQARDHEANVEDEGEVGAENETEVVAEGSAAAPVRTVERVRGDEWRSWAIALGAARGPQPLGAFEKLFVESYMPLANAIADGLEDPRATRAYDEFRHGFARSYSDAFVTFGLTARRPRMVMDAYDVAAKQARSHSARTTHVVVVDSMRYDVGCAVRDEIARRAPGSASLISESLLWSALPTTTYRQLETLARGIDALRAPADEDGPDSLRGRSAENVRRLRVGSRELYKLDAVPSMLASLREPSVVAGAAGVVAAVADLGPRIADSLLRHIDTLPPRTLLFVLGDHGFTIDRRGRITDGGASPEEVLVPCLAYLVGELH